ncbi:hypothetical protein BSKO_08982 [Bryopsis sp. KO-2023]|nr:hypothetical protein BSKO_08982 [Bryopsis sp. KO-2023]
MSDRLISFFKSLAELEDDEKETAASSMLNSFGRMAQAKNWKPAQIFFNVQHAMNDSLIPKHIGEGFLDKYTESHFAQTDMSFNPLDPKVSTGNDKNKKVEKKAVVHPPSQHEVSANPPAGCEEDIAGIDDQVKEEPQEYVEPPSCAEVISLLDESTGSETTSELGDHQSSNSQQANIDFVLMVADGSKVDLKELWKQKIPVDWMQTGSDSHKLKNSTCLGFVRRGNLQMNKFQTADELKKALEDILCDPFQLYTVNKFTMILERWTWTGLLQDIKNPNHMVGRVNGKTMLPVFSPLLNLDSFLPIPNLGSLQSGQKRELHPPAKELEKDGKNPEKRYRTEFGTAGSTVEPNVRCSICSKMRIEDMDEEKLATKGWIWNCRRGAHRHVVCFRGKTSIVQFARHAEMEFLASLALELGFKEPQHFALSSDCREGNKETKRVLMEIAVGWEKLQHTWADRIQKTECPRCEYASRRGRATWFLEWLRFLRTEYCMIVRAMGRCAQEEFQLAWTAFDLEASKKLEKQREENIAAIRSFWSEDLRMKVDGDDA